MGRHNIDTVITQMVDCARSGKKHPVTIGFATVVQKWSPSRSDSRTVVKFVHSKCTHDHAGDAIARLGGAVCSARAEAVKEILKGKLKIGRFDSNRAKFDPELPELVGKSVSWSVYLREKRVDCAKRLRAELSAEGRLLNRLVARQAERFGLRSVRVDDVGEGSIFVTVNGAIVARRTPTGWAVSENIAYASRLESATFEAREMRNEHGNYETKRFCLACRKAFPRYKRIDGHLNSDKHRNAFESMVQKFVLWMHKAQVAGRAALNGGRS